MKEVPLREFAIRIHEQILSEADQYQPTADEYKAVLELSDHDIVMVLRELRAIKYPFGDARRDIMEKERENKNGKE